MANMISQMVNGATDSFVNVAVAAIVIASVFGLAIAQNSTLVQNVQSSLNDGMTQLASLVVLVVIILVLALLRNRA